MSTPSRLLKGTSLTLSRVGIMIFGQILTVPIYLSHWDAQTYGIWLILQGMLGYLSLFSVAFQQFSYGEVLKQGPNANDAVRRLYWNSLCFGYAIAALEFVAILGFGPGLVEIAVISSIDQNEHKVAVTVFYIILLYSLQNVLVTSFRTITAQTLTIYGHYPRMAAWGVVNVATTLGAPPIAVLMGADLFLAGLVLVVAHAVPSVLSAIGLVRLARCYALLRSQPIDWRLGLCNALYSLPLAGRTFIDSFRQQGFRIILGTYAGATVVTALATTRTFANVLHQGLSTITAPLMPELMRYVVNRDQDRMEGAFAIVWLCVFALLVPGVLILCLLAEPVFVFWTRGAVSFDPVLFLTLLVTVIIFASAQPAAAILQGQNRIAWMISISVVAALCLGAFTFLLVAPFGLVGAGFALLGAELCAATLTVAGAVRALRKSGLDFPRHSFSLVAANVGVVFGLSLLAVTALDEWSTFMVLPFAVNALFATLYWATIPALARGRIRSVLATIRASLPGFLRAGAKFSE